MSMRLGVMVGEGTGAAPSVPGIVERTQQAEELGLHTAWVAQICVDAIAASTAAGMATERIEIGTAVVPTHPRHPYATGQAAATAQSACGGRFTLGIGLSHKMVIEGLFGLSYDKPIAHLREYLEVLGPLSRGEEPQFDGQHYSAHGNGFLYRTEKPYDVLVAALGPQMLRLTGQRAGGTITWAAGLATLEQHIGPTLRQAAEEAGRPAPRVVAGMPVVLTGDPDLARQRTVETFGYYASVPSYRAMLDREGAQGIEDIAILGDEAEVRAGLRRLEEAGVTDLCLFPYDAEPGSGARTLELLGDLARS